MKNEGQNSLYPNIYKLGMIVISLLMSTAVCETVFPL